MGGSLAGGASSWPVVRRGGRWYVEVAGPRRRREINGLRGIVSEITASGPEPQTQVGRLSQDGDDALDRSVHQAAATRGRRAGDRVLRSSSARSERACRIQRACPDRHIRSADRDCHCHSRRHGHPVAHRHFGDLRCRPGWPCLPGRSGLPRMSPPPAKRFRGTGPVTRRCGAGQRLDREERLLRSPADAGQLPACRGYRACLPQVPAHTGLPPIRGSDPRQHQLRHRNADTGVTGQVTDLTQSAWRPGAQPAG